MCKLSELSSPFLGISMTAERQCVISTTGRQETGVVFLY